MVYTQPKTFFFFFFFLIKIIIPWGVWSLSAGVLVYIGTWRRSRVPWRMSHSFNDVIRYKFITVVHLLYNILYRKRGIHVNQKCLSIRMLSLHSRIVVHLTSGIPFFLLYCHSLSLSLSLLSSLQIKAANHHFGELKFESTRNSIRIRLA